jgi:LytS/YehU family sensor histidine kinase
LFNTLANLRVLVATDTPKALFMLDRFNDFLRSTLSASRAPSHALQQEFDRLSDYLALMGLRLGDRLQTELSLPDDLAQCRIPTLLLQPLVENALVHGLEPVVGGGKIWVRASRQAQQLLIEVGDTGVGCRQTEPQRSGFGLTQVRERLQTAYGAGANLQLLPNEPRGTLVRITLPLTP